MTTFAETRLKPPSGRWPRSPEVEIVERVRAIQRLLEKNSDDSEAARFEADLLERGEAQELTPEGKLPPGATHAIVKKPDGTRGVKRGRFSLR